tara:strand:- start:1831 stop:2430 length:600 start_codon:yes stop_codon:yes gene_type:complete
MESYHIQSYCHIRDQEISLNGTSIFKSGETNFADFIKSAYKILDTHYPKFFKMDSLSKLAFMATEVLLTSETEKNMALVVSNRAASLETDRKHYNSLVGDNPYASPALFVYTLPNICLGEISIRHGLLSENSFFIFEDFNAEVLQDYADNLLATGKTEKALCGWIDMDSGKYDAFLYVVAKSGMFDHSKKEINRLYKTE